MSVKILYKSEDEKLFWEKWDELTRKLNAGPVYLRINQEHNLSFLTGRYLDKSFVYLENKEPLGCAFLPIEKTEDGPAISLQGGYVDAPLALNDQAQKKIFSIIDDIAAENQVKKIKFSVDVLSDVKHNYLVKYNFLETSILTYLIDLSADMMTSMRKGHRSDIKTMRKDENMKVVFLDKDNISAEDFLKYEELHHKCSGRVTRPKITFDLQLEKIRQGAAMLTALERQGEKIAFCYFEYDGDKGIYGSAADDPDYDKLPLYHILVFAGMEYLKKKGVRLIDTGQPSCPSPQFDYYPDAKQLNIALFKRGFGGFFKENFRGIKYFSREVLEKELETFRQKYDFSLVKNKNHEKLDL